MYILKHRNISVKFNRIGVVMASVLASNVVDLGFELR